jgi:hypothetical protein
VRDVLIHTSQKSVHQPDRSKEVETWVHVTGTNLLSHSMAKTTFIVPVCICAHTWVINGLTPFCTSIYRSKPYLRLTSTPLDAGPCTRCTKWTRTNILGSQTYTDKIRG